MGSDLSRPLVDAAAEQIRLRNVRLWKHSDETQYRLEASDVLTEVFRLLADEFDPLDERDCHPSDTLRRLAGEIREARDE